MRDCVDAGLDFLVLNDWIDKNKYNEMMRNVGGNFDKYVRISKRCKSM